MIKNSFPARWWEPHKSGKILCTLCPRYCTLGDGQQGFCFVRKNLGGKLYSLAYGRPTGFGLDPIEKKPLNHFLPGTEILSFGTAGCNLGCKFCQNWSMSKAKIDDLHSLECSPEDVIKLAKRHRAPSIAFTYNDPVIFGEYVIDISRLARQEGIKSVMVTAGYIDARARKDVFQWIDAANVDLKAFSERFYRKLTLSSLESVLDTLKWLKNEAGIWFEITTLLIPGENDHPDEISAMCGWILSNLGDEVPLHFTAFHPAFQLTDKPSTPLSTVLRARQIAMDAGVRYCYVGNVHNDEGQTTYCPKCSKAVIRRDWQAVTAFRLTKGKCPDCGGAIAGIFDS